MRDPMPWAAPVIAATGAVSVMTATLRDPAGKIRRLSGWMVGVRIVVVGGGVAGLAAAFRLREHAGDAVTIMVVERSDRLGGKLRTSEFAGARVEAGAEMFLIREGGSDSAAVALARRLDLDEDLVHPATVPAAIAVGGALRPIPAATLLGVPSDLSTLDGLVQTADRDEDSGRPLLAPGEDVAVGTLVRRRLGDEVVDRLVDPVLGGVYAGRADTLSLAATIPALHTAAQHRPTLLGSVRAAMEASPRPPGGAVFATVRGGMSRLVDAIATASRADLRLGSPVRELARTAEGWRLAVGATRDAEHLSADAVVLAVASAPAARLLRGVSADAADEVGALDYASVALVTFAFPPDTILPGMSGFLVPASDGFAVKAVTFVTTKWPQLYQGGPVLVRASLGRHGEEQVLQRTDEDLVGVARADLDALLGVRLPEPLAVGVTRWGGALPQYGVGHVDRIARARAALPGTLGLAGAAYDGVGISACVRSGQAAADSVWAGLTQSRA